jgi:mannose-6-phosphate isomerase-like protein (cupin superfamily)
MIIKHLPKIKKRVAEGHGETSLYQIFWQGEEKPEAMKSFSNFGRITVKPGGTNKVHMHEDVEQVYLVLRGGGTVQVGDGKAAVKAGDAVFLPAKVSHGFFNTGDKTAVLLLIGTRIIPT